MESLDDHYTRGRFTGIVEERRAILPRSAKLFMLRPPPGSFPKPPTPDFNLVLTINTPHRVSLDLGAGRWRKLSVAGDMGLQPANSAADIVVDDPHQFLIVSMPEVVVLHWLEELGPAISGFGVLHATNFSDPLIEQPCLRIWAESQEGSALGALFVDTAVATLITLLAKMALGAQLPTPGRSGLSPPRLRRVIDYDGETALHIVQPLVVTSLSLWLRRGEPRTPIPSVHVAADGARLCQNETIVH